MKLKPKNWDKFQHYRDRCPPWIKLHRDILNDRIFASLPVASKALAPLLWLLASESKDGEFDAASDELAFRLHFAIKDIETGLKPLIDNGFFVDASTMLAPCYQVAIPEREGERETETERKGKFKKIVIDCPSDVNQDVWKDWVTHRKSKDATITETVIKKIRSESEKAGVSFQSALELMCVRNWQGFQADWVKKDQPTNENNMARRVK
jgi:hypothetical protein